MKLPRRRTDPTLTPARLPVLGPVEPTTRPTDLAAGKIARLQQKAQVKAEKRRLRYEAWTQEQTERDARRKARRETSARRWRQARQYAPLIGVNACAVVGQVGFFTRHLGLNLPIALMLAAVLESIAIYLADVAKETLLAGDSALRLRVASYLLGGVIGGLNYAHYTARLDRPTGQAVMFGLLSSLSPWLWAIHAKRTNRNRLAELGQLDRPLVKFSAARWLYHPVRTFRVVRWAAWHSTSRSQQDVIAEYELRRTSAPEIWLSARPSRRKRNLLLWVLRRRASAAAPDGPVLPLVPAASAAAPGRGEAAVATPDATWDFAALGAAGNSGGDAAGTAAITSSSDAAIERQDESGNSGEQSGTGGGENGGEEAALGAAEAAAETGPQPPRHRRGSGSPKTVPAASRRRLHVVTKSPAAWIEDYLAEHDTPPTGKQVGEAYRKSARWGRDELAAYRQTQTKGAVGQ